MRRMSDGRRREVEVEPEGAIVARIWSAVVERDVQRARQRPALFTARRPGGSATSRRSLTLCDGGRGLRSLRRANCAVAMELRVAAAASHPAGYAAFTRLERQFGVEDQHVVCRASGERRYT